MAVNYFIEGWAKGVMPESTAQEIACQIAEVPRQDEVWDFSDDISVECLEDCDECLSDLGQICPHADPLVQVEFHVSFGCDTDRKPELLELFDCYQLWREVHCEEV